MNKEELKDILEKHKAWLEGKSYGERADLSGADLRWADLREADLSGAGLRGVNLRGVNLHRADLRGANLNGANLDYSCFPLWCGGVNWTVDDKLPRMLAAFICSMKCDDKEIKEMQRLILPYAEKSHRAKDILN